MSSSLSSSLSSVVVVIVVIVAIAVIVVAASDVSIYFLLSIVYDLFFVPFNFVHIFSLLLIPLFLCMSYIVTIVIVAIGTDFGLIDKSTNIIWIFGGILVISYLIESKKTKIHVKTCVTL